MKPTEEQIKEVWFWCGLRCDNVGWYIPKGELGAVPDVYVGGLSTPVPDLNNLFQWAVPKTKTWDYLVDWAIEMAHAYTDGRTLKDPALALFWAIWKVIV